MNISKIETFTNQYVGFVRVTVESGETGWGQVSTYNSDITCQILHRQVAPWALGKSATNIDEINTLIEDREHKFPGSYVRRAMAGLDTALWDLQGKLAGKPVTALLGGTPGKLRAYASSMKRDITPTDEAERMKKLQQESGFNAFKFRVGSECGHDQDEWPGRTEEIVPVMRTALGDDAELLVDGNSCYSPKRAIEVGRMLEQQGVCHFEEPCPYWEMEQTREVTAALNLDVTGGEQDWDLQHWRRMMAMKAVDIIQPDVLYMGGMTKTLKVTEMGEVAGYSCTPHCANLSMVTLFTMHLLRAIPNAGKYLEFSIEGADYYPWQQDLFLTDPYDIEDGHATVTDQPGWGVEIDPGWLNRSDYQVSAC
jgi:L-alanine-DL-glutamate epimerase-like enolase superfamily enzyme